MILCEYKKCMIFFYFSVLFVSLFLDVNGLPQKDKTRNKNKSSSSHSRKQETPQFGAGSSSTTSGRATSISGPSTNKHKTEQSPGLSAKTSQKGLPEDDDFEAAGVPSDEAPGMSRNARRMMRRRRQKEAETSRLSNPGEGEIGSSTGESSQGPSQSEPKLFPLTVGETTILIPLFVKFDDLRDNPDAFFESENVVRLPGIDVFVVCDSKEAADDFREAVIEDDEFYSTPISFFSHVTLIRNIPKDITDGEIGLIMFENYYEFPSKIQFVSIKSRREQQLKMAMLQVSDPLLEKIKSSPNKSILVRGVQNEIDLCLIIDRRDEEDTVPTYSSNEHSMDYHQQGVYDDEGGTDLNYVNALNFQAYYRSCMEKWKAQVANYYNIKEVFDKDLLITDSNKDICLIIMPKIHQLVDVFIELQNVVTDPSEFGVQYTCLFASNLVMVYCNSKDKTNELSEVIEKSPRLAVTPLRSISYEVWVHDLPVDITDREVNDIICAAYTEAPEDIRILNYREKVNTKLARLQVNEILLKKMYFTPALIVLRDGMVIHSPIQMKQCVNCGLLGHRLRTCPLSPSLLTGTT